MIHNQDLLKLKYGSTGIGSAHFINIWHISLWSFVICLPQGKFESLHMCFFLNEKQNRIPSKSLTLCSHHQLSSAHMFNWTTPPKHLHNPWLVAGFLAAISSYKTVLICTTWPLVENEPKTKCRFYCLLAGKQIRHIQVLDQKAYLAKRVEWISDSYQESFSKFSKFNDPYRSLLHHRSI